MSEEGALARLSWGLILAVALAAALGMSLSALTLDWPSLIPPAAGCLALGILVRFYRTRRPEERIAAALACIVQLIAFSIVGEVLSYAVASAGRPLWDETFHAFDRALGLDWRAYLAFVDARPRLGAVYSLAYDSIMPQIIAAAVALGLSGRLAACRRFAAGVILSGAVTILISGLMPAMAMYVHLGLEHARDYPNLQPSAAFVHVAHITALRDGTLQAISLRDGEGIITFPSYHAALGVVLAAAFWQVPWLRWPGLALNALMIAATPIDGGHYFIDVLAGMAIAALSVAATYGAALGSRPRLRAPTPLGGEAAPA